MKSYGGVALQIHVFSTSALFRGEWTVLGPGRFAPWKDGAVTIGQEAGWAPEPVWTLWSRTNVLTGTRILTPRLFIPTIPTVLFRLLVKIPVYEDTDKNQ
jgi:hypothetical protein